MEKSVKDIATDIKSGIEAFVADLDKAVEGNKSAGQRSRKQSLALEKLLKEWRKASVGI